MLNEIAAVLFIALAVFGFSYLAFAALRVIRNTIKQRSVAKAPKAFFYEITFVLAYHDGRQQLNIAAVESNREIDMMDEVVFKVANDLKQRQEAKSFIPISFREVVK